MITYRLLLWIIIIAKFIFFWFFLTGRKQSYLFGVKTWCVECSVECFTRRGFSKIMFWSKQEKISKFKSSLNTQLWLLAFFFLKMLVLHSTSSLTRPFQLLIRDRSRVLFIPILFMRFNFKKKSIIWISKFDRFLQQQEFFQNNELFGPPEKNLNAKPLLSYQYLTIGKTIGERIHNTKTRALFT